MRNGYRISGPVAILFWLYILVEIALFILIGRFIGVLATLSWILITAIFGFMLLRYQKAIMMKQMQQMMQGGSMTSFNMFGGTFLMFAGILLILPGFLTDLLGILFLLPKVRFWLLGFFMKLQSRSAGARCKGCSKNKASGETIEGECWHDDDK